MHDYNSSMVTCLCLQGDHGPLGPLPGLYRMPSINRSATSGRSGSCSGSRDREQKGSHKHEHKHGSHRHRKHREPHYGGGSRLRGSKSVSISCSKSRTGESDEPAVSKGQSPAIQRSKAGAADEAQQHHQQQQQQEQLRVPFAALGAAAEKGFGIGGQVGEGSGSRGGYQQQQELLQHHGGTGVLVVAGQPPSGGNSDGLGLRWLEGQEGAGGAGEVNAGAQGQPVPRAFQLRQPEDHVQRLSQQQEQQAGDGLQQRPLSLVEDLQQQCRGPGVEGIAGRPSAGMRIDGLDGLVANGGVVPDAERVGLGGEQEPPSAGGLHQRQGVLSIGEKKDRSRQHEVLQQQQDCQQQQEEEQERPARARHDRRDKHDKPSHQHRDSGGRGKQQHHEGQRRQRRAAVPAEPWYGWSDISEVFSNLPATSEYVATACSGFQGGGGTARVLQAAAAAAAAAAGVEEVGAAAAATAAEAVGTAPVWGRGTAEDEQGAG